MEMVLSYWYVYVCVCFVCIQRELWAKIKHRLGECVNNKMWNDWTTHVILLVKTDFTALENSHYLQALLQLKLKIYIYTK